MLMSLTLPLVIGLASSGFLGVGAKQAEGEVMDKVKVDIAIFCRLDLIRENVL